MPKIQADRLEEIGRALFVAAGTPKDEAALVMRHIVGANLVGHDSHGVIQIPTYIERIKVGHIVPGAPWVIVKELADHTVVDGHWAFGYVANEKAMRLTIEKAEKGNVAAATVFRQGHIGRLSSYTPDGGEGRDDRPRHRRFRALAQGGGAVRRARGAARHQPDLDRHPLRPRRRRSISTWRPRPRRPARSRVAVARNESVPDGWVIGSDGKPTNDPRQLRQGGALLPMGGPDGGYKGYGLAVMVEILCGLLTGLGFGVEPTGRHNDGCFMACFKVDAFRPLAEFKKEVGEFIRYLKETPPAEGSSGVLYPGEIEHIKEQDRRKNGIEVEDATWARLRHPGRGIQHDRPARHGRVIEMIGAPLSDDRLTLYGSFTSSSSYKPMLYLALARLPFSFRTVNLKIGVQNEAGIPGDQPLGRGAEPQAQGPDDPAIERDPRLSGARDRALRGPDRAGEVAGARVAVVGSRPHHRGGAGAALGAVPQDARRGHRRVPPARRGGAVVCRQDGDRPAVPGRRLSDDRRYRLLGPHGVHGRGRVRDWPTGRTSKPGPTGSRRCPASRCPTI